MREVVLGTLANSFALDEVELADVEGRTLWAHHGGQGNLGPQAVLTGQGGAEEPPVQDVSPLWRV